MGDSAKQWRNVRFRSKRPRNPDPLFRETDEDVRQNNEFDVAIRLSTRSSEGLKERHLVLMVNGLAEQGQALYRDDHVGLASLLAEHGVASALVPLPFHMNRLPRTEFYRRIAKLLARQDRQAGTDSHDDDLERGWSRVPAYIIANRFHRFYLAYRQLIADLRHVAIGVAVDPGGPDGDAQYKEWFDQDTRIHLLGYSLGGLGCLAAFLKSRILSTQEPFIGREPAFATCTLLCSGASFLDLEPSILKVSKKNWDDLRDYYYRRAFEVELEKSRTRLAEPEVQEVLQTGNGVAGVSDPRPAPGGVGSGPSIELIKEAHELSAKVEALERIKTRESVSYRLFERIILGTPWASDVLERNSHRVLAVVGAQDPVVPWETILRLQPDEREFLVLEVPQLEHAFVNTETWKRWAPYVGAAIADFMQRFPSD